MTTRRLWLVIPAWSLFVAWVVYVLAVWPDLPARMAVHFAVDGNPNRWATKYAFAIPFSLAWMALMVAFSWATVVVRARPRYVLIAALYFTALVFAASGMDTLRWNLGGYPGYFIGFYIAVAGVPVMVLSGIVTAIRNHRGGAVDTAGPPGVLRGRFRDSRLIAVERHWSRSHCVVATVAALGIATAAATAHEGWSRTILIIGAAFTVFVAMLACRGFRYEIRGAGLRVSSLGVRFLYLPSDAIQTIEPVTCNPLREFGGWGIRGNGRIRAFILGGKTAVRIQTNRGIVFLGTASPERVAHSLTGMDR